MWPAKFPLHAGRYKKKEYAIAYAEYLRVGGAKVEVVENSVYDVIIVEE